MRPLSIGIKANRRSARKAAVCRSCRVAAVLLSLAALPVWVATATEVANDYPTDARADYVFACMAANGGTQKALQQCACSIDVIGSVLPYADYERADTVLRMRRMGGGYLAQTFRTRDTDAFVRQLREAQAEAEVRCF
jgi:hypothetical protein